MPFQMTLLSLAVADLLTCLSAPICNTIFLLVKEEEREDFSVVYGATVAFSTISSQMHVIFITIQRLIAVLFPFSCKRILTSFRCSLVLALIWAISLATIGVFQHLSLGIPFMTLATAIVIALSYALIVYRIRNRPIVTAYDADRSTGSTSVIIYSGILFVLFVSCYFPYVFNYILYSMIKKTHETPVALFFLFWLNSVTNPLVYFLFKVCKGRSLKCFRRKQTVVMEQEPCPP